jgi:quercetin dioxygenase-like cupin family protein
MGAILRNREREMLARQGEEGFREVVDGIRQKTLVHGATTLMVEFRLKKGALLPMHSHPHEQTGYLVKGLIRLTIGDVTNEVEPGGSWCIPGDMPHAAEIIEDSVAIEVFSPVREEYLP